MPSHFFYTSIPSRGVINTHSTVTASRITEIFNSQNITRLTKEAREHIWHPAILPPRQPFHSSKENEIAAGMLPSDSPSVLRYSRFDMLYLINLMNMQLCLQSALTPARDMVRHIFYL